MPHRAAPQDWQVLNGHTQDLAAQMTLMPCTAPVSKKPRVLRRYHPITSIGQDATDFGAMWFPVRTARCPPRRATWVKSFILPQLRLVPTPVDVESPSPRLRPPLPAALQA